MAIKDIASNLKAVCSQIEIVGANGATQGATIDTANYELGLMFTAMCVQYTDGDYAISAEESDDGSTWTNVPSEKIIGTATVIDAAVAENDTLSKFGVFSNKRYVRSEITATNVTTGAIIIVMATMGDELMPVA